MVSKKMRKNARNPERIRKQGDVVYKAIKGIEVKITKMHQSLGATSATALELQRQVGCMDAMCCDVMLWAWNFVCLYVCVWCVCEQKSSRSKDEFDTGAHLTTNSSAHSDQAAKQD